MTTGIYGIFDSRSKECLYVGQSKSVEHRFRQHVSKLKNKRSKALRPFVDWYHENGAVEEILLFEILEECEDEDLIKNELEAKWFDMLGPRFFGKTPSLSERWSHSEETKIKIADGVRKAKGKSSTAKRIPCTSCSGVTRNANGICRKCQSDIQAKEIDEIWKDRIISWYVSEKLSCREIARRMNMEEKISIPYYLRRYGIEVKPRTFNGKNASEDHRRKLSESSTKIASEKAVYIRCLNCNSKVRSKPSRMRKFCSRHCYLNHNQALQESANV